MTVIFNFDDMESREELLLGNTICWLTEKENYDFESIEPQEWTEYHNCPEE